MMRESVPYTTVQINDTRTFLLNKDSLSKPPVYSILIFILLIFFEFFPLLGYHLESDRRHVHTGTDLFAQNKELFTHPMP